MQALVYHSPLLPTCTLPGQGRWSTKQFLPPLSQMHRQQYLAGKDSQYQGPSAGQLPVLPSIFAVLGQHTCTLSWPGIFTAQRTEECQSQYHPVWMVNWWLEKQQSCLHFKYMKAAEVSITTCMWDDCTVYTCTSWRRPFKQVKSVEKIRTTPLKEKREWRKEKQRLP